MHILRERNLNDSPSAASNSLTVGIAMLYAAFIVFLLFLVNEIHIINRS